MKAILLPSNSLEFLLVKVNVIVSKIAYKSLKTTKNSHFLRTNHRNVVHENFFRALGEIICIKNLFKPIRVINRTNSWAIWTRISEDIDHFSKRPATPPLKKTPIYIKSLIIFVIKMKYTFCEASDIIDPEYMWHCNFKCKNR